MSESQSQAKLSLSSKISAFFEKPVVFKVMTILILIAAVITRFVDVESKPFHHDESLHAYYSQRVAQGHPHVYDGMLHGPFLYYCVGSFLYFMSSFHHAGVDAFTDFNAHVPASLFGVLVVMIPLLLRRYIGNTTTLILMLLLLISPTTMYFGRFLREDVFTSIWVLGTVFGVFLFWLTRRERWAYFAIVMLAFHFTNKENSYLHAFLWGLALVCIAYFGKKFALPSTAASPQRSHNFWDKFWFYLNCFALFSTIFILFYSAFFRHPNGPWNGVLDGLYNKSLKYWWEQNQKRRIDGPFDYHLPILANYEFLLLPFIVAAWYRILTLSRRAHQNLAVPAMALTSKMFGKHNLAIVLTLAVTILTLFAPRLALVPEACGYSEYCLNTIKQSLGETIAPLAKHLHIAHTRHFLQIVLWCVAGGIAFFAAIHARRKADAFLWFWLTGALGVYSYVGEKVPWLTVYIVLPLILIAGMELARLLTASELPIPGYPNEKQEFENLSLKLTKPLSIWLLIALPFTGYKAIRASFMRPADPKERLVFTQTTPQAKSLRDRWTEAVQTTKKNVRISVQGEATWPFAWYIQRFEGFDFAKPTPATAEKFDGFILDYAELEMGKKSFPNFRIYAVPLRAWWVPPPDPSLRGIFRYFILGEPYGRRTNARGEDEDIGLGDTGVLYFEKMTGPLASLPRPDFLKLLHEPSGQPAVIPADASAATATAASLPNSTTSSTAVQGTTTATK